MPHGQSFHPVPLSWFLMQQQVEEKIIIIVRIYLRWLLAPAKKRSAHYTPAGERITSTSAPPLKNKTHNNLS